MSQRSPKFFLREKVIAEVINVESLNQTWKKKTHSDFRNFILTDPVDFLDVNVSIKDICRRIVARIKAGEYSVSGTKRYSIEKTKGLCRQMTLPSVEDALTLQCLADAFWSDIKAKSPSKNAFFEPKDHSFSKTINNEPEYGSIKAWLEFQKAILGFSEENNYIVVTDIANYYDFIDFLHLRNVIVSIVSIREPVIDFLMYILSGMCWKPDYMPTREIGMPQMDVDAPRLLAHCFLFELDAVMEDMKFANYARFMDDIDAGAKDIAEAKKIIKSIDLTLQTRQLRLNSGKTRILTFKEARRHFRILENQYLKWVESNVIGTPTASLALKKLHAKWHKRKVYDDGNGEKILKRIIGFASTANSPLDRGLIYEYIRLRPNIRQSAFRFIAQTGYDSHDINAINKIIDDGHVCDDAFILEFARSLLHANIANDTQTIEAIRLTIERLWSGEFYSFYSGILLSFRFEKGSKTVARLASDIERWRHDHHLGRLVGGLAPIAQRDSVYQELSQLISSSLNADALGVQNFHYKLRTDPNFVSPIMGKLKAKDSSFPCGIRIGKWLVLNSVLQGDATPKVSLKKIKTLFAYLNSRPYFGINQLATVQP